MAKVERILQQRQARARVAVKASRRTGDLLPRRIYQLAGDESPGQCDGPHPAGRGAQVTLHGSAARLDDI